MKKRNAHFMFLVMFLLQFTVFSNTNYAKDTNGQDSVEINEVLLKLGSNSYHERAEAGKIIISNPQKYMKILINKFDEMNLNSKYSTIQLCIDLKYEKMAPKLCKIIEFNNKDSTLIIMAIYALGKITDKNKEKITGVIVNILEHTVDSNIKKAGIISLSYLGKNSAIPVISKYLWDSDIFVRLTAAGGLGFLNNNRGENIAIESSMSDNQEIKDESIEALGLIGTEKCRQRLMQMQRYEDDNLLAEIGLAIFKAEIKEICLEGHASGELYAEYLKKLVSKNRLISKFIINELVEDGSEQAISILKNTNFESSFLREFLDGKLKILSARQKVKHPK